MKYHTPKFPANEMPGDLSVYDDCSAVIVGKRASANGEVIFGHNEDDSGDNVMVQYIVPAREHMPGSLLEFEPECAKIPQVEKTWKYYWSETRADWKAPFSDIFVNEWGVAVASDSCGRSREDNPDLKDGGVGYALGHIIAKGRKVPEKGVLIAASLVEEYGYAGHARAYSIVDKDEGWVMQIVHGRKYVAQRVPDDEVMFIPNRYTIDNVDMEDKENFICSPDLITYAIKKGWHDPKEDFSFLKSYQDPEMDQKGNEVRHRNALRQILECEPETPFPFSVKPSRKISVQDVMDLLRSHYEGTSDDLSQGYKINPHRTSNRTICTKTTLESFVLQLRENPMLNCMWRATLNPCTSPYVPWYLCINEVPPGYGWIDPEIGLKNHFDVPLLDLSYRPGRAWWAFQDVQDLLYHQYKEAFPHVKARRDQLEALWADMQQEIEHKALSADPRKAVSILSEHTNRQTKLVWRTWRNLFQEILNL